MFVRCSPCGSEPDQTRRSLAIGGALTRSDIDRLLEMCDQLVTERERIATVLRRLGPAWTDGRAALNELHAALAGRA